MLNNQKYIAIIRTQGTGYFYTRTIWGTDTQDAVTKLEEAGIKNIVAIGLGDGHLYKVKSVLISKATDEDWIPE